jgi:DNA integrity scanning protein DisA with diadenylate cyclase activity
MEVPEAVVKAGVGLAKNINASAMLLLTETGETLRHALRYNKAGLPLIAATPSESTYESYLEWRDRVKLLKLPVRRASGIGQIEDVVARAVGKGLLQEDDLIVAIGSTILGEGDSLMVYRVKRDVLDRSIYAYLRRIGVKQDVFDTVLGIALEIGREGRGGRPIGTAFLIGDSESVLRNSKQLILNPFQGQDREERIITNPDLRESVKELAQLDGVFVITGDGIIEAAGRYLTANARAEGIPRGLGARHAAVGAATSATNSLGITVSQSGGIVRIFKKGKIIMTIEPRKRIILREKLKQR